MIGIRPEHTREVIKGIIEWRDKNYFIEEMPTTTKALADWAYARFEFRSKNGELLAENTVQQLFGEIGRVIHGGNICKRKKRKR